jgi:hypothetical protein
MSEGANVQQEAGITESKEESKGRLAQHVEQQPASVQTVHKVMLALEAVVAILYIGLFIAAIYVSVTWQTHGELAVPRWWMFSMVSVGLLLILFGFHSILVKAHLPLPSPSGKESFVTGQEAVKQGWMFIGMGLLWAALWAGMYLYIVLTGVEPLETFIPFVVIVSIGVGVIGGVVPAVWKRVKSR